MWWLVVPQMNRMEASEFGLTPDSRGIYKQLRMTAASRRLARMEQLELMTAREVATLLKVRPKRVYELGIPYVKISGRAKRWERTTVCEWIKARSSGQNR